MKTTIIKILDKIANGEQPPKKIYYKQVVYEYDEDEKDYANEVFNEYLFDSHVITDILNDEVKILEITLSIKNITIPDQSNNLKEEISKLQSGIDKLGNQISQLHNEAHSLRDSNTHMKNKLRELMKMVN